jgi:hypothetical protein
MYRYSDLVANLVFLKRTVTDHKEWRNYLNRLITCAPAFETEIIRIVKIEIFKAEVIMMMLMMIILV